MHLAIPFAILMGSLVAAAPSTQHAQISVEVTPTDAENQAYALHSSEEPGPKNLPFNFTLSARHLNGDPQARLSFGFENLNVRDGFIRGELGFSTEFVFHNGTLITGNRALGHHLNEPWPPWTSLWSLNIKKPDLFFDLIAISKLSEGRLHFFIEFVERDKIFGAFEIKRGEPVFVGPSEEFHRNQLLLEVEPIRKPSDDINDNSEEKLL